MVALGWLIAVVLMIPLGAVVLMWEGYVLSVLWAWFAVPAFGLPPLSIPLAIGLALVAGALTNHKAGNEAKDPDAGWSAVVIYGCMKPAVALLFGWIAKGFM
jgi:hypothetical protein